MKVAKLKISNVLGIDHMEIEPGSVTVIKGQNGTGKTSVIEALKSILGGGHRASLLRQGELVGEIVLVMDDGMEIRKRITESKSTLSARHPQYGRLQGPAKWLKSAVDQIAVNPVAFLTARNRSELLLQAMPIEKDMDALQEILDSFGLPMPEGADLATHALPAIESVRDVIYRERTGVNRVAREAKASAKQLKRSLPDPDDDPGEQDVAEMEVALTRARQSMSDDLHEAEQDGTRRRHAIDQTAKDRKAAIDQEAARQRLEVERWHREQIAEIQTELDEKRSNIRIAHEPDIAQQVAGVSAARERQKAHRQHENTRAIMDDHQQTAQTKQEHSERLTAAIDALDELKTRQLAVLPVAGLTIDGKDISLNGIPYSTLNRAEQVRLAVEVAKLRAGDIPLVCLDGCEALDSERFELLTERLKAEGIQAIITTVSDDPELQIETES